MKVYDRILALRRGNILKGHDIDVNGCVQFHENLYFFIPNPSPSLCRTEPSSVYQDDGTVAYPHSGQSQRGDQFVRSRTEHSLSLRWRKTEGSSSLPDYLFGKESEHGQPMCGDGTRVSAVDVVSRRRVSLIRRQGDWVMAEKVFSGPARWPNRYFLFLWRMGRIIFANVPR